MANDVTSFGSDPYRRQPNNQLRVNLYKYLLGRIQEEDQASGAFGYVFNWDDPASGWDSGDPNQSWDKLGFRPVIQTLFYCLESMEGEDLGTLESLDDIVDPWRAPVNMLPFIAASLGYDLEERLDEATQRQVVSGLVQAFKTSGQFIGFKVFYRMAGFKIINVFPLWKVAVEESLNRYSRVRYETTLINQSIGPAGNLAYVGRLSDAPIKPGTLRVTDTNVILRDTAPDPQTGLLVPPVGQLIGPNGETGTVSYSTGQFTVELVNPAAGAVTAGYERIDTEFPYHAARIDIEIVINPGGDLVFPVPLVDNEVVRNILLRAEEARPIHVLLRALTLITELVDTVSPMATDLTGCTTHLQDVRDGSPALFIPGKNNQYFLDHGIGATDVAYLDRITGGVLTRRDYLLEDRAEVLCPMDALIIQSTPGGTVYA